MSRNIEKSLKDMENSNDQRIKDLTNQMKTANEKELNILRYKLAN